MSHPPLRAFTQDRKLKLSLKNIKSARLTNDIFMNICLDFYTSTIVPAVRYPIEVFSLDQIRMLAERVFPRMTKACQRDAFDKTAAKPSLHACGHTWLLAASDPNALALGIATPLLQLVDTGIYWNRRRKLNALHEHANAIVASFGAGAS